MEREKLPVIFRAQRTKDGDVTAVFPTLPWSDDGSTFTIYAHLGQHGAGSWTWYLQRTRRAKPAEYAELLSELDSIYGRKLAPDDVAYELVVYQRWTAKLRRQFQDAAARLRRMYREAAA